MTQLRLRWFFVTFVALGCVLLGANHAWAQATTTGTVVGTITDPSGAVIAGAEITLSGTAGQLFKTTSNNTGQYIFATVPPGTYTITTTKTGFSTTKTAGISVELGQQATVNLKMSVGSAQETVEVQVTGEELQTLNNTVGQTLGAEQLSALPSLNHDANTFTSLQPGVSVEGGVAGAVNDQSTFLLDGGNDTNDMDGGNNVYMGTFAGDPTGGQAGMTTGVGIPTGAMPTPTDSVQEATINTANQTADFDNSAGAQVEFVTPRGTNHWHGGVYEYYLDSGVGANSWENNQTATPLSNYHYNRFGAKAGGFILPNKWGGRTYLWAWYEGLRYPNAQTIEATVPSAAMESGMLTETNPTTGTTATYNMASIDPRGIGINPDVQGMWTKYEPPGNDLTCASDLNPYCDGVNTVGFKANVSLPQTSNNAAIRLDHDFSAKWHWFASYRYYRLNLATDSQYDIGGFFSGDTKGTPAALSSRPQIPSYYVTGLTTNITANTTNDFHYSFLRDYWQWGDDNAPTQVPGLGGALEPGGETQFSVLAPFNVNAQDIRTRFWDGHDNFFSDNVSMLKGNHLIQWGGQFQHNYDYHERSDNGGGINFTTTYQLGDSVGGGLVDWSDLGGGFPINNTGALRNAAELYGIVTEAQTVYTRSGPSLTLQPPLTHAFDQSTIKYYNAYISDTWHMKPSLTLNYGMGYTIEMPPTEAQGKQTVLVDAAGEPVKSADYLTERKTLAEQGTVYNPELGFSLVGNVGAGEKYPYNPFYGSFSPRVGLAWNPSFSKGTVIRGGYGRIYGRLNGVDLVLVPLLGVGLMQPVQCKTALSSGVCGTSPGNADTAFRVGIDGNTAPLTSTPISTTAPQPIYTGVNFAEGSANEAMDPSFRPNAIDSFDLTVQRQIGQKMLLQVGYIGRLIHHEYQPVNLNAVPYMMSVGGQQFQQAYANIERALGCATSAAACGASVPSPFLSNGTTPNPAYASFINSIATQPFFEAAMKASGICGGTMSNGSGVPYASCTAAALDTQLSNFETQSVWSLWSSLDGAGYSSPYASGGFTFAPSMLNTTGQFSSGVALNASTGYGNYNGGFISFGTHDWHGLTTQSNFTWSKALGTGAVVQASSEYTQNDAYNLGAMYGEQYLDRRLVYNTTMVATEPWFKGQNGLLGRVAGGWTFAPIFTAGSGAPVYCNTWTDAQSWGAGDGADYFDNEQCVFTSQYNAGHSAHYGVTGNSTTGVGTATSVTPVNMFSNPQAVWNQVRAPILGIDTKNPGVGPFMGLPYWNVDGQVKKDVKITESTSFEFSFIAANLFNHNVMDPPYLSLSYSPAWGVLNSQASESREMEFGGRVTF